MKRVVSSVLTGMFVSVCAGVYGEVIDEPVEKVFVTATLIETGLSELPNSVTLIDGTEAAERHEQRVAPLLRFSPGVSVIQSGGPGGDTSVFIRGANSSHTLVLVDGIVVNDPVNPSRTFDFAHLPVCNIDRIEVLRGPQSTLYGSDAMGGVVNVITKKGEGEPRTFFSAGYGSFDTYSMSLESAGSGGALNYSAGVSYLTSSGFSAADEDLEGNKEDDGYRNFGLSLRGGYDYSDTGSIDVLLHYIDTEADVDNAGGPFGDDPNRTAETESLYGRISGNVMLFDDRVDTVIALSYTDMERSDVNKVDAAHPMDSSDSVFESSFLQMDMRNTIMIDDYNTGVVGFEYKEEKGESESVFMSSFGPFASSFGAETATTKSVFAQDQFIYEALKGTVGVRVDDHHEFGAETTYRGGLRYNFYDWGTSLKATYGTGFKAPTLFQLYSSYGNADLDPETSRGWDAGLEQEIIEEVLFTEAVYFRNDFDDLIDYDTGTSTYVNVSEAMTQGCETALRWTPYERLEVKLSYTYTETEDKDTGEELLRRPQDMVSCTARIVPADGLVITGSAVYYGESEDLDFAAFPARRVTLDDFVLVGIAGTYDVNENVTVFGKIDNLFNEDYQQVYGYGTAGFSVFAGFSICI